MGCSSDDLVMWRDFPKGLRVLLLDEDTASAAETKSKLEAMDYVVSTYCNEEDAVEAISTEAESFHVAIVEVTRDNSFGSFKFLDIAKGLPTIVISNVPSISTTVKCIALGAAEFLQKPYSEDKLRNIWQHVVHKAFSAGGEPLSKSLGPIKETVESMLQLHSDKAETQNEFPSKSEINQKDQETEHLRTKEIDILSAPSTPQLVIGGRLMEDGDFNELTNFSLEKESMENSKDLSEVIKYSHSESKSVDNTSNNLISADRNSKEVLTSKPKEAEVEEEVDSNDGSRTQESNSLKGGSRPSHMHGRDDAKCGMDDLKKKRSCSHGNKGSRKRMKVDWTPELHKKFIQAVEELGVDQAIPSKILELMKVEGLTRHNIASHLQKYRIHRRHILPKHNDNIWPPQPHRDPMSRGYMPRPPMFFPPFHSNYGLPPTQVYPVWGHPSYHHPGIPMWGYTGLSTSTWHPPQGSWLWNSNPGNQADAWGCPVATPCTQFYIPTQLWDMKLQSITMNNSSDGTGGRGGDLKDSYDFYLTDKVIDEVVKEAMSKPWLPLPLGLKPPSTDSVLAELQRQGIRSALPPCR
ncbi:two-component response regulator-like APRR2 isoform X1 [Iris pallida]|uniref:Two-component response regulator-like APRR2 isoform X1 n=1 Tax=Iris pallida TaxID=29817 RepID=A0AAX6EK25_IRIPA|nr:two-component response regulator-like APRR2 isoform X1 [Iris pallida]